MTFISRKKQRSSLYFILPQLYSLANIIFSFVQREKFEDTKGEIRLKKNLKIVSLLIYFVIVISFFLPLFLKLLAVFLGKHWT